MTIIERARRRAEQADRPGVRKDDAIQGRRAVDHVRGRAVIHFRRCGQAADHQLSRRDVRGQRWDRDDVVARADPRQNHARDGHRLGGSHVTVGELARYRSADSNGRCIHGHQAIDDRRPDHVGRRAAIIDLRAGVEAGHRCGRGRDGRRQGGQGQRVVRGGRAGEAHVRDRDRLVDTDVPIREDPRWRTRQAQGRRIRRQHAVEHRRSGQRIDDRPVIGPAGRGKTRKIDACRCDVRREGRQGQAVIPRRDARNGQTGNQHRLVGPGVCVQEGAGRRAGEADAAEIAVEQPIQRTEPCDVRRSRAVIDFRCRHEAGDRERGGRDVGRQCRQTEDIVRRSGSDQTDSGQTDRLGRARVFVGEHP